MKQLVWLLLFIITSVRIFSQEFKTQQITFVEGADCRNFSTPNPDNSYGYFVFEADYGSKTNILLGRYDYQKDNFYVVRNITDNNFRNINPIMLRSQDGYMQVVYQTNENGSWDIAYRTLTDSSVSSPVFIANSPADETNPRLSPFEWDVAPRVAYNISFISGMGAGIATVDTIHDAQVVFYPSGDNYYYSPVLVDPATTYNFSDLDYYAIADSSDYHKYIVERKLRDKVWQEKTIFLSDTAIGLSFNNNTTGYGGSSLTYDAKNRTTGFYSIYYKDPQSDTLITELMPGRPYDIFDLHTEASYIVTAKKKAGSFYSPFAFKCRRNDSLFIAVPYQPEVYLQTNDTLIYTKVKNTTLSVGRIGMEATGEAYLAVWQDSVNGHVQLFGKKTIYLPTDVKDKTPQLSFTLEQNYPNPFNPSTKISYNLLTGSQIKLTIYNMLGEAVAVPVNEYQTAGPHEINFSAKELSSGVYFYQLKAGSYTETRKMMLMK